jgi:hypothetical protein
MDENSRFRKLLDQYRDSYLQFVTTGSQSYKDAYEKVLTEITGAIAGRKQQYSSETEVLNRFMDEYGKSQSEIENLQKTGESSVNDIQEITNAHISAKDRYTFFDECGGGGGTSGGQPATLAFQRGFEIALRLGIMILIIIALFIVGYFFPGEAYGFFGEQQRAVTNIASAVTAAAVDALTPRPAGFGTPGPLGSPALTARSPYMGPRY